MKKAWIIFFCSSLLFFILKSLIPRDKVTNLFGTVNQEKFEKTLKEQVQDTIDQKRIADSLLRIENLRVARLQEKEKRKYDSIQKVLKLKKTNRDGLKDFFKKLYALELNKNKKIRIGVFGDSMVEGDLIVMQLRNFLQEKFGGKGVGYIPINSISSRGRSSIKHRYNGPWQEFNFMKKGFQRFPFGLNGKTFFIGKDTTELSASVSFRKGSAYNNLPLINPILFYGKPESDSITASASAFYKLKDSVKHTIDLNKKRLLNSYRFPVSPYKFEITIKDKGTVPFYGVSFASKKGIIVDNLAVRANSGLPLSKLNTNLMQQFDKHFHYDLIILAYGTNVFSFESKEYEWYKKRMVHNIKHIQKCFPHADILVSSMADRSQKIDGEMQTPEHLPDFIDTQYKIAKESKSGFFNLYKQMGGLNSMTKWVDENMAAKDYTHLSSKGANKAGKLMFNWLMKNYEEVKPTLKKKNIKTTKQKTKIRKNYN